MTARPGFASRRAARRFSLPLLLALVGSGVVATSASAQPDDAGTDPSAVLEELVRESGERVGVRGGRAVDALSAAGVLDDVADNVDMDTDELVEELVEDPTMFVTVDGMVGYAEPAPLAAELTDESAELDVARMPR